jgi:hypothetical protein
MASVTVSSWQGQKASVLAFLDHAAPGDLVGLFLYPVSEPALELTPDHAAVRRRIETVVPRHESPPGKYNIRPSEVVDISAGDAKVLGEVIARECQGERNCGPMVQMEASSRAAFYEMTAARSLGGFRTLMDGLRTMDGPKRVIVISGQLMASDRVAARMDVSGRLAGIADEVAKADAQIYVVHLDDSFFEATSVANPSSADPSVNVIKQMADAHTAALGLEQLAGTTKGTYIQIAAGTADRAFDRVLRETTAYYLLGVATEPSDRDGKSHFVRVSVKAPVADVHYRQQVVINRAK